MATPKPPDPAGFERHLKGVATGEGKWTATSNGNRPRNAVHYGYEKDGDPLYVCRAQRKAASEPMYGLAQNSAS